MDSPHYSRVEYDIPQEQLNYFDSRARSSQNTASSVSGRVASEKRETFQQREPAVRVPPQTSRRRDNNDDDEPKVTVQRTRLSDQYMQHFAAQLQDPAAVASVSMRSSATAGAQSGDDLLNYFSGGKRASTAMAAQRPKDRQLVQKPARLNVEEVVPQNAEAQSAYCPAANSQRNQISTPTEVSVHEVKEDFYWSHNAPSATSQRSVTNGPREPTIRAISATGSNRGQVASEEEVISTQQNQYEQPRGDHQAPMRKSSISCGTPVSRDSRSRGSESAGSTDISEAPQRMQRAYISRHAEGIPPVRQPIGQQQRQLQQPRPQHALQSQRALLQEGCTKSPDAKQREEEAKKRDEEENCTFHPQINDSSRRQNNNYYDSPYHSSEETNLPRDSRGDYDRGLYVKLHNDAKNARRTSNSRQIKKNVDDVELEINEKYGVHATAINPHRLAVKKDASQEEVFARLYADAQRYNREKAEQEKFLEMKRKEERGEAPFDWNKGRDYKDGATEGVAMSGDEKSASQPGRSSSQHKSLKNMVVFERLARPTSVKLSYQKQKEIQEQEKQEKDQRELEQKKTEMGKFAGYNWGIPAKSFTFADLESQNAMYVA